MFALTYKVQPYVGNQGISTASPRVLTKHLSCPVPGCTKDSRFSSVGPLRRHLNEHHADVAGAYIDKKKVTHRAKRAQDRNNYVKSVSFFFEEFYRQTANNPNKQLLLTSSTFDVPNALTADVLATAEPKDSIVLDEVMPVGVREQEDKRYKKYRESVDTAKSKEAYFDDLFAPERWHPDNYENDIPAIFYILDKAVIDDEQFEEEFAEEVRDDSNSDSDGDSDGDGNTNSIITVSKAAKLRVDAMKGEANFDEGVEFDNTSEVFYDGERLLKGGFVDIADRVEYGDDIAYENITDKQFEKMYAETIGISRT